MLVTTTYAQQNSCSMIYHFYDKGLKLPKPLSPIAGFNNSGGTMNFNSVSSRPSSATNTLYAGLQHSGGGGISGYNIHVHAVIYMYVCMHAKISPTQLGLRQH